MTYQNAFFCAACKRDYFQHLAQGTLTDRRTHAHYFARRAMAKIVDVNLIVLIQFAVAATLNLLTSSPSALWPETTGIVLALTTFVVGSTIMITRYGGTPGKLLFYLRVVYRDGSPVRLGGALMRTVAEFASMACVGLGYLVTDSEGKRRTLHDRISGTEVALQKGDWPWT
jgi:uncharacterized RDD family membrane protein YckC